MTRDEITHAKTAYNCAVSCLRAFVATAIPHLRSAKSDKQLYLDILRDIEREIELWHPTPDEEGDTNGHER